MEPLLRDHTFVLTKQKSMNNIADFIQQKQSTWFKEWFDTSFYHRLYANRNEHEANAFVDNLVAKLQPSPHSTMLDLGCGSGRHAKRLAHHGYEVTGLDLAASSIREPRCIHTPGPHFYHRGLRLPLCASRLHCVFNFFTAFVYFNTNEENYEVINNISMAVKPNATLVIHYPNVAYSEQR